MGQVYRYIFMQIIAVTNQKGGVGKTTTALNVAHALSFSGNSLLIDLDPQGNATTGAGLLKNPDIPSMTEVLLGECGLSEIVQSRPDFSVAPANDTLIAAEVGLHQASEGVARLSSAIESLSLDFDWVVIDCPPTLGMLTLNALYAARVVLVPVQCEYFALEGLSSLLQTLDQVRGALHSPIEHVWVLRTLADPRNRLNNEVSLQLTAYFGKDLFQVSIPRNVRLAEAPSYGKTIFEHDSTCAGAVAYQSLADEMQQRLGFQRSNSVEKEHVHEC